MIRVWYHKNCNDGFCAAWIASKCLTNAQFTAVQYGDPVPEYQPGDLIYILDFSFKRPQLEKIINDCTLILLDHHKTAEKELSSLEYGPPNDIVFDMSRSGAQLTYDYFKNQYYIQSYRFIVDYVADRDLWKFELPNSLEFNNYLFALDYTFSDWDNLVSLGKNSIIEYGKSVTKYKNKIIKELLTYKHVITLCNNDNQLSDFVAVNCSPHFCSEVAGELAKKYNTGITYYKKLNEDNKLITIYSIRGKDARIIAESFGGGGHDNAAGFIRQG